jgi:DnaJ-class molecular chaperone
MQRFSGDVRMEASARDSDYYSLLGVSQKASVDEIRAAFHRFAREHHPDNFAMAAANEQERHAELYRLGTEAYRILLDPMRRQLYDEDLNRGQLRYVENRARERQTTRPGGGMIVRSAKARTFFAKARHSIASEDWAQAKLNLQLALHAEPSNTELQALLDGIVEKMKKG